jgi:hypothetical protein
MQDRWLGGVVAVVAIAAAVEARAQAPELSGFVASGPGQLQGTVTREGKPVANAVVHLVSARARREVRTDSHGTYRATLGAGEHHVFVEGPGRIAGTVSAGDDVIELHDITPPKTPAKLKGRADAIPPYSDAAMETNAWARAWLMLHIDARGAVTHVKLLTAPGHGLDETAVGSALALRFDPAKDRAGRPTRSLVVWSFEWPAYWWMREQGHPLTRLPPQVANVECRDPARGRIFERDCSKPDLALASKRPWIARSRR